jgi:YVTN family beta-propeller protein
MILSKQLGLLTDLMYREAGEGEQEQMKPIAAFPMRTGATLLVFLTLFVGCTTVKEEVRPKEEARPQQPLAPRIYVANESSNSVTVIDLASLNVIATVNSLNHSTHDLSISRDGKILFATNLASGKVSVIDTERLETVASISTGSRAHVVTLTNDNRHAWVANIADDNISIVDTETLRILGTVPVGKGPTGLAFSRDGRFAFVSNQGDKAVEILDVASHQVVKTIPVGNNPHFLVLGPDGRIWGTNTGDDDIFVIDPVTLEKIATYQVGSEPQQIAFGFKGIRGPNAYVTVSGMNKVVVLNADLKSMRVLEQIDVGQRPNGIWANPEGTRLYVVHESSNDLRVIDTGTSEVIGSVPVGRKPIRVIVSR